MGTWRTRMFAQSVVTIAVAAACSSDPILFSAPPTPEGAVSVVLAFESPSSLIVVAMDLARPQPAAVVYRGEDITVYSFAYRDSLRALGLSEGRLRVQTNGRRLPPPLETKMNIVGESGERGWSSVTDPAAPLARIELEPGPDPCADAPQFDVASYRLELKPYTNGRSVVLIDEPGTVLLTTQDQSFYRLSRTALSLIQARGEVPPNAFRAADGELWMGGRRGELWRGTLSGGFQYVASASTSAELVWLAGPTTTDAPFELFGLDKLGSVHHFTNDTWTRLARGLPTLGGGVIWMAPGKAYVARHSSDSLLLIEDGQLTEENPTDLSLEITAIGYSPALGLAVGTSAGTLHVQRGPRDWVQEGAFDGVSIQDITAYDDGYFIGGAAGYIATHRPGRPFCVSQLLVSSVEDLQVVGDDIAVSHPNRFWETPETSFQPTFASWLARRK